MSERELLGTDPYTGLPVYVTNGEPVSAEFRALRATGKSVPAELDPDASPIKAGEEAKYWVVKNADGSTSICAAKLKRPENFVALDLMTTMGKPKKAGKPETKTEAAA